MLLLSLLATTAFAREPHAPIVDVALDGSGNAWAIVDRGRASELVFSSDDGAHWDYVGGAPNDDTLTALGWAGGTVIAGTDRGEVWIGSGGDWARVPVPVGVPGGVIAPAITAIAADGDHVAIATTAGLVRAYASDVAGTMAWEPFADGEALHLVDVAITPGGFVLASRASTGAPVASAALGAGLVVVDQASFEAQSATNSVIAVAVASDIAYAGSLRDMVYNRDPGGTTGWGKCSPLPISSPELPYVEEHWFVEAFEGGVVVVGTGQQVFLSASWCSECPDPADCPEPFTAWVSLDIGYTASYGVGELPHPDGLSVWADANADRIAIAGYGGVFRSRTGLIEGRLEDWGPEDLVWDRPVLAPGSWTRSVTVLGWPETVRVYGAQYGGGLVWTDDGGTTWSGSAIGLDGGYTLAIAPEPYADVLGRFWLTTQVATFRSSDAGETWTQRAVGIPFLSGVATTEGETFVIGREVTGTNYPRVYGTRDRGETWTEVEGGLAGNVGPSEIMALVHARVDGAEWGFALADVDADDPYGHCAGVGLPCALLLGAEAGGEWEVLGVQAGFAAGVAAWPPGDGEVVVLATTEGVWTAAPREEFTQATSLLGRPRRLAAADDGTLLLVTRGGEVWASIDAAAWEHVGGGLRASVYDLETAPDFASNGFAAAGTTDGMLWTDDRGATWHSYPRHERLEATTHLVRCAAADGGACAQWEDPLAGLRGGVWLTLEGEVSFTFRGTRFELLDPELPITAIIDGQRIPLDSAVVDGLGDGWHDVSLSTGNANGVMVDAIYTWGPGEVAPEVAITLPEGGCCGERKSENAAFVGVGALVAVWRRRYARP